MRIVARLKHSLRIQWHGSENAINCTAVQSNIETELTVYTRDSTRQESARRKTKGDNNKHCYLN